MTRPPDMHDLAERSDERDAVLRLAWHCALPVVVSPELVHLLRVNFFSRGADALPHSAEADLLLAPSLFVPVGDGLFEMAPDARDTLLQKVFEHYGPERLREIALLLWLYGERRKPWRGRPKLERAQQLTALSILDPPRAREWLERAQRDGGAFAIEERGWFAAMSREIHRKLEAPEREAPPPNIPEGRRKQAEKMAYVLYAEADVHFVRQLETHVAPWKAAGALELWHVGMVRFGEDVVPAVRAAIAQADIVLLLVSADFLTDSTWIEMPALVQSGKHVLPILIGHCRYEETDILKHLRMIPDDGIPVAAARDRDEAWVQIVRRVVAALGLSPDRFRILDRLAQDWPELRARPHRRPARGNVIAAEPDYGFAHALENVVKAGGADTLELWGRWKVGPGESWRAAVDASLTDADIVIALLSPDFLASEELMNEAIRAKEQGIRVVPILARLCSLEITFFYELQTLPRDGRPLSASAGSDDVYEALINEIQRVVEDLRGDPGSRHDTQRATSWILKQSGSEVGRVLVFEGTEPGTTVEHWGLFSTFRWPSSLNTNEDTMFEGVPVTGTAASFKANLHGGDTYVIAECETFLQTEANGLRRLSLGASVLPSVLCDAFSPAEFTLIQGDTVVGWALSEMETRQDEWCVHCELSPPYQLPTSDGSQGITVHYAGSASMSPAMRLGRLQPGSIYATATIRREIITLVPHFLDGERVAWEDRRVQAIYSMLTHAYDDIAHLEKLALKAGINLARWTTKGAMVDTHRLFEVAAAQGKLRKLLDMILEDKTVAIYHDRLREMIDAPDPGDRSETITRMPGFLDRKTVAWEDRRVQAMNSLLMEAYDDVYQVERLALWSGINLAQWRSSGDLQDAWHSLFEVAAAQGKLRNLLDTVLEDESVAAYHDPLREMIDAPDPADRGETITQTPHFLDGTTVAWGDRRVEAINSMLMDVYDNVSRIRILALTAGIDLLRWKSDGSLRDAWHSLFEVAAAQGKLRKLLDTVFRDPLVQGIHDRLHEMINAPGPADSNETIYRTPHFLDRARVAWEDPRVEAIHSMLMDVYDRVLEVRILARSAGIDLARWSSNGSLGDAWHSLFEVASAQGKLRRLLDTVLEDEIAQSIHLRLRQQIDWPDPADVVEVVTFAEADAIIARPTKPTIVHYHSTSSDLSNRQADELEQLVRDRAGEVRVVQVKREESNDAAFKHRQILELPTLQFVRPGAEPGPTLGFTLAANIPPPWGSRR